MADSATVSVIATLSSSGSMSTSEASPALVVDLEVEMVSTVANLKGLIFFIYSVFFQSDMVTNIVHGIVI